MWLVLSRTNTAAKRTRKRCLPPAKLLVDCVLGGSFSADWNLDGLTDFSRTAQESELMLRRGKLQSNMMVHIHNTTVD